ncbi:hypothetical protein GCK72_011201 [Caenorhabditis remanei]|uniref:Uncharacterized protein n=1 Tax=Caenorhabditis remanei TaxID=31234 RepID=A0A6A5H7U5_CAERE|nr:hypothetical protein GCK72_011201 [Caenorhabditis remanei]KAF1762936.1 hypothetical protein GCK72_011201 [Caenorhabditis remanei]
MDNNTAARSETAIQVYCLRPYRNPFGGTSCQEEVKKDFEALRRYPQMPISGYPIYRLTTRKYYQDTNDKEDFSTHTRLKDTARSSIHLWMSKITGDSQYSMYSLSKYPEE